MSDETSAAIRETRKDWIGEHRDLYLRSQGRLGHMMDVTAAGGLGFTAHCLIKYRGRKSGKIFITPLIYGAFDGEIVVVASKGGADHHPEWYLNMIAAPEALVQIGGQAFRATWREPEGAERENVWALMVGQFPPYASYQASTARQIPLFMMKPIAEIPAFKAEEATGVRQF